MAKAAFLLPYPEMCEMLSPMLSQCRGITPMCVEHTLTGDAERRGLQLEQEGCDLLVARGLQAMLLQRRVRIPVVEIRVTTQELGVLILELRRQLNAETPTLALIGFPNLFPDTTHFDELFGVHLRRYMVKEESELQPATELAAREGADAIIGGEVVCGMARRLGVPHHFLTSGAESLQEALLRAEHTGQAIDMEKRNSAEINLIFNAAHSGLVQLDRSGSVVRANARAFDLLGRTPAELLHRPLQDSLPTLDRATLDGLLGGEQDSYATLLDARRRTLVVSAAPLEIDGSTDSVLLTMEEGQRVIEMDSELRRELYRRGFIARYTFANVVADAPETQELNELAKRIARFRAPILLTGEIGSGKQMMAQCIHNESPQAGHAFAALDCSAWQPETLDTMLFGNYTSRRDTQPCLAELAQDGTLYLSHVDALPYETQYKLLNLIRGRLLHNGSNEPRTASVRVIASTNINLIARVEAGSFRDDLYYALNVLSLQLLPLRRRRADIRGWVERGLDECQNRHKRYVRLTDGAWKFLTGYDWPGNLDQLESVCERIVLLARKRTVDEVFLRQQLDLIAPRVLPDGDRVVVYRDPRAVQLSELLQKHHGDRAAVAAELGISKTTLWRHMKKYGIEA